MSDSTHLPRSPGTTDSPSDHDAHSDSVPTSVSAEAGTDRTHAQEKKRRRPALACEQCRKRKVRCDRAKPCGPCLKAHITPCTYAPTHVPVSRGRKAVAIAPDSGGRSLSSVIQKQYEIRPAPSRLEPAHSPPNICLGPIESRSSHAASIDDSASAKSPDVDWLIKKVQSLQEKLDSVTKSREKDDNLSKRWTGQATLQHQEKGTIIKTRYYGRGHWLHGAYLFPMELSLLVHAENTKDELYWNLARSKDLARKIKESRPKPILSTNLGGSIPSRGLADQLVEAYIRAFEGPMRILHIPCFRNDYERFWQNPEAASTPFVMQLQLCLAIGAALYDDTFTLRQTAVQWVYEAQLWLMLPPEKDRLTYTGLQIMCLVCLARTVCSVGSDLAWLGAGGLLRMAIYMGLHRDPRQLGSMSVYRAEMRRRLWATIMELDVQFAIDCGAASTLDGTDYDTLPPANLDDDQLTDEPDKRPGIPDVQGPTQTSVQIALHRSLRLRMAILRHINGIHVEDSYNVTLSFNSSLTKECRLLSKTLQELRSASEKTTPDGSAVGPVNHFHVSMAELAVYRMFHPLHQPVVMQSLEDPHFYFSRKMFLDSALKIAQICRLTLTDAQAASSGARTISEVDFDRFLVNGAGMIRNVVGQSLMGIGIRLIHLKEEQCSSMGYFSTGFDEGMRSSELRNFLQRASELARRRVRSGETGTKFMCFVGASLARHDKTVTGAEMSAIQESILEGATLTSREGLVLLKERALLEGTPLPVEDGVASEPANEVNNWGLGVNTIFSGLQACSGVNGPGDGMDWMADWAWEDMSEFGWPPGPQQMLPQGMPTGQPDMTGLAL